MKLKALIYKKSMLFNILTSYVLIGTMLITILSSILFTQFSKKSIEDFNSISEKMLHQSSVTTTDYWDNTIKYLLNMFLNDDVIRQALYADEFQTLDKIRIMDKMDDILLSNYLIHSIYIYNSISDSVFSTVSSIKSKEDFVDQDIFKYISNKNEIAPFYIIPRKTKNILLGKEEEYKFISLAFSDEFGKTQNGSLLIINLNQDILQKLVTPQNNEDFTSISIIDNTGNVVSDVDQDRVFTNVKKQEYIKTILNSKELSGNFMRSDNGKQVMVTYIKSKSPLKWIFISQADYKYLVEKTMGLRQLIIKISLLFIILSILIAIFYSSVIYFPINKLLKKIKVNNINMEIENNINEYGYLSNAYETLMKNVEVLNDSVNNSSYLAKKEFLRQLINGEDIDIKKTNFAALFNNEITKLENYQVCVLKIDDYKKMIQSDCLDCLDDIFIRKYCISDMLLNIFRPFFIVEVLDYVDDQIVFIISMNNIQNSNVNNQLIELISDVQRDVKLKFGYSFTAAIGRNIKSIKNIHISYKHALAIMEYKLILGQGIIITEERINLPNSQNYEYPYIKEKQLIDALKLGDRIKTFNLLNELFEIFKSYTCDLALLASTQLILSSSKVAKDILDINETCINFSYVSIQKKISSFDTLDEIEKWIMSIYDDILNILRDKHSKKNEDIVIKIQRYIIENFKNSSITIELIAHDVGLSTNYARILFKEFTGDSLTNYINQIRFDEAKKMLLTTDYTAKKISEKVGFGSSRYFYTSFKKLTGKSPDDYRKQS